MVTLRPGAYKRPTMRKMLDEIGFASQELPSMGQDVIVMNPLPMESYRISKQRVLIGDKRPYFYVVRVLEGL